jgi:hypothetical protein
MVSQDFDRDGILVLMASKQLYWSMNMELAILRQKKSLGM